MVPVHERLIEGLHPVGDTALLDQVRNVERLGQVANLVADRLGVDQDLRRRHSPLLVGATNEAQRDDRAQRRRQHVAHFGLLVRRVERQDAVDGLRRIGRVQRREHEVTRLRRLESGVQGVEIADLAHEQNVGILPQHAAQRLAEAIGVGSNFALVDATFDISMEKFDRIFDRDDVRVPVLVDVVEHRREGRRFSGSRDSRDENQAAGHQRDSLAHLGEVELRDGLGLERHGSERIGDRSALLVRVDAEASDARHREGEVRLLLLGELLDVLGGHDLLGEAAQIFLLERRQLHGDHVAIDAERRRPSDFEVKIRCIRLDHVLEHGFVVEVRPCRGRLRSGRSQFWRLRNHFFSHWDLRGGGPGHIRRDARSARESPSPLRRIRTRSRS